MKPSDFRTFFQELHGREPFPWQEALAHEVCETGWPPVIDVPTGSGKTACIDIAVFALACAERAPRRIFYVVDRRILVNDVYQRMGGIAKRLGEAKGGVLQAAAERLTQLSGDVPLRTYELRGGIYRDHAWVKTPLQPMVVTSTVDQIGSRLLFRGYGVSESARPVHAAMIANDALIFLDEAHVSRAFAQTLERFERYRGEQWASTPLNAPFAFVEMTATPARSNIARKLVLGTADKSDAVLAERLYAKKPVRLVTSKARAKDRKGLAEALVKEALTLAESNPKVRRVAILTNRVATARHAYDLLKAQGKPVELLIGRMRPLDRDAVAKRLDLLRPERQRREDDPMQFVVATQCLEVGADLDFDVLVSECASIDALLQRFGRLNRVGKFQEARGAIVIAAGQATAKEPDAVYGEALTATWCWLTEIANEADEVNVGIASRTGEVPTVRERLMAYEKQDELKRLGPDAAILLPMHLDTLVQTSPAPYYEPDISVFLRGRQEADADVRVVWRADLNGISSELWKEIVALCPPSVAEGMPVPFAEFRRWAKGAVVESGSDLEGVEESEDDRPKPYTKQLLVWRGEKSEVSAGAVRPGDTVVLATEPDGPDTFGHMTTEVGTDCAEAAFQESRRRTCLRVHRKLVERWPEIPEREAVLSALNGDEVDRDQLMAALRVYREAEGEKPRWLTAALAEVTRSPRRFEVSEYPADTGPGIVFTERGFEEDDGFDSASAGEEVLLSDHVDGVLEKTRRNAEALLPGALVECVSEAARLHDTGKLDVRFQALLRGGDLFAAQFAPKKLAKGVVKARGRAARARHRELSELPAGFRHELLSLLIARAGNGTAVDDRELMLHLIASHHGYCRPFAPVVKDEEPREIECEGVRLSRQERIERASHRLDSGVADRFWSLTRKYGWWGLAYLESALRLADWAQSESEQIKMKENGNAAARG